MASQGRLNRSLAVRQSPRSIFNSARHITTPSIHQTLGPNGGPEEYLQFQLLADIVRRELESIKCQGLRIPQLEAI